MTLLNSPPTTETLSKAIGDGVGRRFAVDLGAGRTVDLLATWNRVNVYSHTSDTPVAVLRFGGTHSGALWLKDDLIGEFRKEPTGSYVVVEIKAGFKSPTPIDMDPIKYLLDRWQSVPE